MDAILRPTTPARVLEGYLDLDAARRRCALDHETLRPAAALDPSVTTGNTDDSTNVLPLTGPSDAWNAAVDVNE